LTTTDTNHQETSFHHFNQQIIVIVPAEALEEAKMQAKIP